MMNRKNLVRYLLYLQPSYYSTVYPCTFFDEFFEVSLSEIDILKSYQCQATEPIKTRCSTETVLVVHFTE